jgi:tyrosyl-tRNA synthetase
MPLERIAEIERRLEQSAMESKLLLAREIVARYHGEEVAAAEERWFRTTFSERRAPEGIPEVTVSGEEVRALDLVRALLPAEHSNNELRRLFRGGGIELEGAPLSADTPVQVRDGAVLRIGKRTWLCLRREE